VGEVGRFVDHLAARRHVETADDVEERGLARARGSEHDDEAATFERQVHLTKRVHFDLAHPIDLGEVPDREEHVHATGYTGLIADGPLSPRCVQRTVKSGARNLPLEDTARRTPLLYGGMTRANTERYRWAAVAVLVLVSAYGSWWVRREAMAPAPVGTTFTLPVSAASASRRLALPVPAGITTVLLRLEGEAANGALHVEVRTAGGRMVWSGPARAGSGGVLATVRVPAARLPPGDYVATATMGTTGAQKVARYPFRTTMP
jgi:hypothetical protein